MFRQYTVLEMCGIKKIKINKNLLIVSFDSKMKYLPFSHNGVMFRQKFVLGIFKGVLYIYWYPLKGLRYNFIQSDNLITGKAL